MIVQNYKQGENNIKIEIAENIDDAKKNNFSEGQYSRYYVNGRLTDNYMSFINFIVNESKKNKSNLIPEHDINKLRAELFQSQKKEMQNQLEKIKKQYKEMNIPDDVINKIDDFLKKTDPTTNVRIFQ